MERENILKANIVTEESELKKKTISILKGSVFSIILSIILLTIFALILTYTTISENTIMPVVLIITGVSIFVGGTIGSRRIKKNGLLYGGIIGIVYIVMLYLASSLCITGFSLSANSFIMLLVGVITGAVGGVVGVNLHNKK